MRTDTGEKTLCVLGLWMGLQPELIPQQAPEDKHGQEAIHMQRVQVCLQPELLPSQAPEDAHW